MNSVRPASPRPNRKSSQQSASSGRYNPTIPKPLAKQAPRNEKPATGSIPGCAFARFQPLAKQMIRNARTGMPARRSCLLIFFISLNSTAPMKRPINMPPQKSETYLLASSADRAATFGWPRKLMIALPTETSPPTYMKIASTPSRTCGYFNAPTPGSILPSPTCGRRTRRKTPPASQKRCRISDREI